MSKILRAVFAQNAKNLDFGLIWRQNRLYLQIENFSEKPPCAFLALIVMNIHVQKLRNP